MELDISRCSLDTFEKAVLDVDFVVSKLVHKKLVDFLRGALLLISVGSHRVLDWLVGFNRSRVK